MPRLRAYSAGLDGTQKDCVAQSGACGLAKPVLRPLLEKSQLPQGCARSIFHRGAVMRYRVGLMLVALWWGSLTGLGTLVVPLLFIHLPTPAMAGAMAARLFTAQTWLGIVCAMLLLLLGMSGRKQSEPPDLLAQATLKFVVAAFLLALLVEFGVAPRIVNARAAGESLQLWHSLGSVMYGLQWLCVGLALFRLSRPVADSALS